MWRAGKRVDPARQPVALWWGIAGLAFALRVIAAFVTNAWSNPEVYEYHQMAMSFLEGKGFVYVFHGLPYRSFEAPLYPLICVAVYAITHQAVAAVLIVQMLVSSANAVLIGRIGERWFSRSVGLLGGLFVACHPGLIIYSSLKAHALTFDALCFSLVVWQFLRLSVQRTFGRSVWLGLAIGVSLLDRPTSLVFLPVGVAWLFLTAPRDQWVAECKRSLVIVASAMLVVGPWLVRDALIHKQFVFIRSTNWEVFWRGNNPSATGHSYLDATHRVIDTLSPEERAEMAQLPDEIKQGRWFRDRALAFIRVHPDEFMRLTFTKLYQFWWFAPQTGLLYPRTWLIGYRVFYAFMGGLALIAVLIVLLRGPTEHRRVIALIGPCLLALSLVQSLHYVEGRHRWAIEPLVLLFSAVGLTRVQAGARTLVCARRSVAR